MVYNAVSKCVVSHLATTVFPHCRVNVQCDINYLVFCVSGLTFHYTIIPLYSWSFALKWADVKSPNVSTAL